MQQHQKNNFAIIGAVLVIEKLTKKLTRGSESDIGDTESEVE